MVLPLGYSLAASLTLFAGLICGSLDPVSSLSSTLPALHLSLTFWLILLFWLCVLHSLAACFGLSGVSIWRCLRSTLAWLAIGLWLILVSLVFASA